MGEVPIYFWQKVFSFRVDLFRMEGNTVLTVLPLLKMYVTLTHCKLNELPHITYWKILILIIGMSGYMIKIFLEKNGRTICKHWRPWSDAAFCGIRSGSALFANYPFRVLQTVRIQWVNLHIMIDSHLILYENIWKCALCKLHVTYVLETSTLISG